MLFKVLPFEARVVSTVETLVICNQSALNQSAANTVGRVAMWPQIVGRSILTRDRPRTPRTLEQTLARSLFHPKEKEKARAKTRARAKERKEAS